MVEVTVKLPDNVARTLGNTPEDVGRRLLENAAIEGYRAGRLSQRDIGEMLHLDYWQTETFLAESRVPLNYTLADLEADRATLEKSWKTSECCRLGYQPPALSDSLPIDRAIAAALHAGVHPSDCPPRTNPCQYAPSRAGMG